MNSRLSFPAFCKKWILGFLFQLLVKNEPRKRSNTRRIVNVEHWVSKKQQTSIIERARNRVIFFQNKRSPENRPTPLSHFNDCSCFFPIRIAGSFLQCFFSSFGKNGVHLWLCSSNGIKSLMIFPFFVRRNLR